MRKEVQELAYDIASSLLEELRKRTAEDASDLAHSAETRADGMAGDNIPSAGQGVCAPTAKLLSVDSAATINHNDGHSDGIAQRISSLEARLDDLVRKLGNSSQFEDALGLSNGKHAAAKQRDVASLLDYIEAKDPGGRTKLVIMNFND